MKDFRTLGFQVLLKHEIHVRESLKTLSDGLAHLLERRGTLIKLFDKVLLSCHFRKASPGPEMCCLPHCLGRGSVSLGSERVQMELKRPTRDLLIWIYQFALVQTSWVQGPTNSKGCRAKVELLIFYVLGCSIM